MFSTECGTIVNKFDKKCCKIVNDMLYCACEDISPRIWGLDAEEFLWWRYVTREQGILISSEDDGPNSDNFFAS